MPGATARARATTRTTAIRHVELRTTSPDQTREVAGILARTVRPGDVVALTGELGAGKTCFVQGAAAALGVTDRVTSPSFLLRRDYRGDVDVLHLDVYRLESLQEVLDLGFAEASADGRHVTFVEWGDAMAPLLPDEHLEVELHLPPVAAAPAPADGTGDPEPRRLVIRPHGPGWARRLDEVAVDLAPWRVDPGEGGGGPC